MRHSGVMRPLQLTRGRIVSPGRAVTLAVTLVSLCIASAAVALDNTFIKADGGSWNDPANWSLGRLPLATDDVLIAVTGPVAMSGAQTVRTLTLSSDLQVSGALTALGDTGVPGLQVDGDLSILENAHVTVTGGLTLNGSVQMNDSTANGGGVDATLEFSGTQTLEGTGEIVFGHCNLGSSICNTVRPVGGGTLTVAAGITVRGEDGTLGGPDGTLVFLGSIEPDVVNGRIELAGLIDNAGETLTVLAGPGSFALSGGTIANATLTGSGELVVEGSGGILDAVTLDTVLAIANNAHVTVTGGLTLNGSVQMNDSTANGGGVDATLEFSGTQTLEGTGEIVFGHCNLGSSICNTVRPVGGGTLTVAAGITVRGEDGTLGGPGGSVVHQGTILADVAGGAYRHHRKRLREPRQHGR